MTRDTDRSKVYEAEWELKFIAESGTTSIDFYGSTLELPEPRKFGDLAGVQAYVNKVYELPQVQKKYPSRRGAPLVTPRGGRTKAHYAPTTHWIALPEHLGSNSSWAMEEFTVLHETAHSLTPWTHHGLEFRVCYLDLLEWCLGGAWRLLLTRAMDQRGVPLA